MSSFFSWLRRTIHWSLSDVYYIRCKVNRDLRIDKTTLLNQFPDVADRIYNVTNPLIVAYNWAKQRFDTQVYTLGPWFRKRVQEYCAGLAEFQAGYSRKQQTSGWRKYRVAGELTEVTESVLIR